MSETIAIMPPEPSEWRIEPSVMAAAFERDWPGVVISWDRDPKSPFAFDFRWETKDYHVIGSFSRNGRAIATERGAYEDIGALAIWFRRMAPPSEPMVVWSGSGANCALTPEMTVADFLRAFR